MAIHGFKDLNFASMVEYVILVNENDEPQGLMEKMEAHEKALLHRAFSVFLFDSEGRMLIQCMLQPSARWRDRLGSGHTQVEGGDGHPMRHQGNVQLHL